MLYASYELEMGLTSQLRRVRAKSQKKRSKEASMHGDSFNPKTGVC
jgi:hypothetical protein